MADEKVIDKIKKLKALEQGAAAIGSLNEAEAAAEAVARLLYAHKISLSDIDFTQMEQDEPVHQRPVHYPENDDVARNWGKHRKTRVEWMEQLAIVIARAHFCSVVVHPGTTRVSLIGRESDIQVAEFMIVTLQRAADKMGYLAKQQFKKELAQQGRHVSEANGFRESWCRAFTSRLAERYRAEKAAATSTSTALVRVNRAEQAVKDFIAEARKRKDLSSSTALRKGFRAHGEGIKRGRAAAEAIDLRANAMKSGNTAKGQLS